MSSEVGIVWAPLEDDDSLHLDWGKSRPGAKIVFVVENRRICPKLTFIPTGFSTTPLLLVVIVSPSFKGLGLSKQLIKRTIIKELSIKQFNIIVLLLISAISSQSLLIY